jgi:hypothetical protein
VTGRGTGGRGTRGTIPVRAAGVGSVGGRASTSGRVNGSGSATYAGRATDRGGSRASVSHSVAPSGGRGHRQAVRGRDRDEQRLAEAAARAAADNGLDRDRHRRRRTHSSSCSGVGTSSSTDEGVDEEAPLLLEEGSMSRNTVRDRLPRQGGVNRVGCWRGGNPD